MAYEKQDPIPPGYYWVDLPTDMSQTQFHWWVKTQLPDHVKVRRRDGNNWVLFRVIRPVSRWVPESGISLPTRATKDTTKADTVQRPDPGKGPLDVIEDGAQSMFSGAQGLGLLVLIYLLTKK